MTLKSVIYSIIYFLLFIILVFVLMDLRDSAHKAKLTQTEDVQIIYGSVEELKR